MKVIKRNHLKYDGEMISSFKVHNENDSIVDFNDFSGNVIFLTVTDINCPVGKDFIKNRLQPKIEKYKEFHNLRHINVVMEKDKTKWLEFLEETSSPGINLRYSGNSEDLENLLKIDGFPFHCVINKEFKIAGHDLCGLTSQVAPFFALHDVDLKEGLEDIFKLVECNISAAYLLGEIYKADIDSSYFYSSDLYNYLVKKKAESEKKTN
jgi:hypothetical protein